MVVNFKCSGVEKGDQYDLFSAKYILDIDKADALALMSELQEMLVKLDIGEIDE